MDYQTIIDQYYPEDNELRKILLVHSRQVADRCMKIAKAHPELKLDIDFLEEAAMLHDIGIFRCNAQVSSALVRNLISFTALSEPRSSVEWGGSVMPACVNVIPEQGYPNMI